MERSRCPAPRWTPKIPPREHRSAHRRRRRQGLRLLVLLALGGGLLALVRPALDLLEPGGMLAVNSVNQALRDDLPRWCQLQHHEYRERQQTDQGYDRHLIARGVLSLPAGARESGITLPRRDGQISAEDVLKSIPMPDHADPSSGFAPRGARVEPGGPR